MLHLPFCGMDIQQGTTSIPTATFCPQTVHWIACGNTHFMTLVRTCLAFGRLLQALHDHVPQATRCVCACLRMSHAAAVREAGARCAMSIVESLPYHLLHPLRGEVSNVWQHAGVLCPCSKLQLGQTGQANIRLIKLPAPVMHNGCTTPLFLAPAGAACHPSGA